MQILWLLVVSQSSDYWLGYIPVCKSYSSRGCRGLLRHTIMWNSLGSTWKSRSDCGEHWKGAPHPWEHWKGAPPFVSRQCFPNTPPEDLSPTPRIKSLVTHPHPRPLPPAESSQISLSSYTPRPDRPPCPLGPRRLAWGTSPHDQSCPPPLSDFTPSSPYPWPGDILTRSTQT